MATRQEEKAVSLTDNDLFIFVHIPKTAGSTFKRMLGRQFPSSGMPKIGPDYQGSIDHIKSLSAQEKAQVRCLSGHIPFGVHQFFEQKRAHYVSFVRDPVDRALSEYFFLRKRPQLMPLIGLEVGTTLSPEAFLEYQVAMGMTDFQTRVLSGTSNMVESVLPPYPEMTIVNIDSLIQRIQGSFSLIGTVEQFDQSLLLMKEKFGWRNVCYISRNVAPASKKKLELKQILGEQIRNLNPMDCRLHAHFKSTIDEMVVDRGESFTQQLRRFRFSNRLYSQAWKVYRATGLRRLQKIVTKLQAAKARSRAISRPGSSASA